MRDAIEEEKLRYRAFYANLNDGSAPFTTNIDIMDYLFFEIHKGSGSLRIDLDSLEWALFTQFLYE